MFVHDRQRGTTVRVSISSAGGETNDRGFLGTISGSGWIVVLASEATDLVLDDTNILRDGLVRRW